MKQLPISFYLQVLICACLWGSAFPVIKNSYALLNLDSYGKQLMFAGTRFTLAGLLILPFCRRSLFSSIAKAPKAKLAAIALGQTYFQYLFFYYAMSVSSGTLGSLLVGAGSFWWVILAPVLTKSPPPRPLHWLLLAFCTIGIALAVYAPGAGSGNVILGAAGFLAATFSGSVAAVYMKQVAPISGSRTTTAFSLFSGGMLLMLSASAYAVDYFSQLSWQVFGITLYLAFLSATAFTIWNRLIEQYSVNLLSAFRFLIPLMGVIESTLFIPGETLGPGIIIGGTIIIVSLFITSRIPAKE